MVQGISFRGTEGTGSAFSDIINKPQAYKGDGAVPASNLESDKFDGEKPKKKHHVRNFLLITAATAGLLALGSRTGLAAKIPAVGKYLDMAGQKIIEKAGWLKDKVSGLFNKEEVIEVAEDAAENAVV